MPAAVVPDSRASKGDTLMVQVGVARVPITPPVGSVRLRGFASRFQPCQSVHDDLWATALAVADEGRPRAVVITADLAAIQPADAPRFEQRIGDSVGVPPEAVWLACSHTHSGPRVALSAPPDPGPWEVAEQRYSLWLMEQLAACAFIAARDLRTAAAGAAVGETRIGINRRQRRADGRIVLGENPDGPVDHRTTVVRIEDAEGRPRAALLHHACHPVVLGPDSYAVSADYVGFARRALEAALGVPVLFLQGACGNINPTPRGTFAVAERLGHRLAGEALRLWSQAGTQPLTEARCASTGMEIELGPLPTPAEARAEVEGRRARLEAAEAGDSPGAAATARMLLRWAEARVQAAGGGRAVRTVPLRVMRWDGLGFAGAPFEPFCQTGETVRAASPYQPLLFCGYTGGVLTYLPVAEAYPEGGYEVDDAFRHFGLPAAPVPAAEGQVAAAFTELLARL